MLLITLIFQLFLSQINAIEYRVNNAVDLQKALNTVLPGDVIYLADGVYTGYFKSNRSGTPTNRISLIGTKNSILTSASNGFYLSANYWILKNFTVADSKKGIILSNSNFNLLDSLYVHHVKEEGVHFLANSSDNTIQNSVIAYTGLGIPGFGEGVYIGSAISNWVNNIPDFSHRNRVIRNHFGPCVAAEAIDIKEGTESGIIEGNYFDGTGMSGENYSDSWMEIKGSNYQILNNYGTVSLKDGFQFYQVPNSVPNSGCGNVLKNNTCNKLGLGGNCVQQVGKSICQTQNELINNITV